MKIHFIHPFSLEKNYGKELNETMSLIPEGDWTCIMDWDCMLLSEKQVPVIYEYVKQNSDAGMLVSKSNRSGSLAQRQNARFKVDENIKVEHQISQAILNGYFSNSDLITKELNDKISGFLMLISKSTWNEIKFNEDLKILDVDRDYARRLISAEKKILLMESIYVWHSYRIWKDVKDTSHLL